MGLRIIDKMPRGGFDINPSHLVVLGECSSMKNPSIMPRWSVSRGAAMKMQFTSFKHKTRPDCTGLYYSNDPLIAKHIRQWVMQSPDAPSPGELEYEKLIGLGIIRNDFGPDSAEYEIKKLIQRETYGREPIHVPGKPGEYVTTHGGILLSWYSDGWKFAHHPFALSGRSCHGTSTRTRDFRRTETIDLSETLKNNTPLSDIPVGTPWGEIAGVALNIIGSLLK